MNVNKLKDFMPNMSIQIKTYNAKMLVSFEI